MSVVRGRPPGLAGGIRGTSRAYCSSLSACPAPKSPTKARLSAVHIACLQEGLFPSLNRRHDHSVSTARAFQTASQVGPLLGQIDGSVASVTGDGAYDRDDVYAEVAARHPAAAVVVPPRANAVPSDAAETAPTRRDRHLQAITEHGRIAWQKASGYNWRALVEADISRWKRVIGNGLRFQTDGRQASEVAIAVSVLNRMLGLGRPEYVRIA